MKNLVLLGFMGAGKTTVGRQAAEQLGLRVVETDIEIETVCGKPIPEIFSQLGEDYFRKIESQVIEKCCHQPDCLVITGGGAVLREENWRHMKCGIIISLLVTPEEVLRRVGTGSGRPLLEEGDAGERISGLMAQRAHLYRMADSLVPTDGKSSGEVVESVVMVYRLLAGRHGSAN